MFEPKDCPEPEGACRRCVGDLDEFFAWVEERGMSMSDESFRGYLMWRADQDAAGAGAA